MHFLYLHNSAKMSTLRTRTKDIIVCLTLSHIMFISMWDLTLGHSPRMYMLDDSFSDLILIPLLIITLLSTIISRGSLYTYQRKQSGLAGYFWTSMVTLASISLTRLAVTSPYITKLQLLLGFTRLKLVILIIVIFLLFVSIVKFKQNKWIQYSYAFVLVMSPIVIGIWAPLITRYIKNNPISRLSKHREPITHDSHKTLWVLLFDELDGATVLDNPDGRNRMPELLAWNAFSINCTKAYPPTGSTLFSIPALIHGRQIETADSGSEYEFNLRKIKTEGGNSNWNWDDSIFSDIKSQGGSTAVIGWSFPYAPLYGRTVDAIYSVSPKAVQSGFIHNINFITLLWVIPVEQFLGPVLFNSMSEENFVQTHLDELNQTREFLTNIMDNPLPDLVWVHYPIPHFPATIGREGTYLDNLKIVDTEIAEFRKQLQIRGRFDEATVIILGDHWFRKTPTNYPFSRGLENRWHSKDHRTPFIIKLPPQSIGIIHENGFNSIVTRGFIKELRSGGSSTPRDVGKWLDQHTPYSESPATLTSP